MFWVLNLSCGTIHECRIPKSVKYKKNLSVLIQRKYSQHCYNNLGLVLLKSTCNLKRRSKISKAACCLTFQSSDLKIFYRHRQAPLALLRKRQLLPRVDHCSEQSNTGTAAVEPVPKLVIYLTNLSTIYLSISCSKFSRVIVLFCFTFIT